MSTENLILVFFFFDLIFLPIIIWLVHNRAYSRGRLKGIDDHAIDYTRLLNELRELHGEKLSEVTALLEEASFCVFAIEQTKEIGKRSGLDNCILVYDGKDITVSGFDFIEIQSLNNKLLAMRNAEDEARESAIDALVSS